MPNAQGSEPSAWLLVELKAHARLRATPLQPVAMVRATESGEEGVGWWAAGEELGARGARSDGKGESGRKGEWEWQAGGVESVMPPSVRAVIVLDQEGGRIVGKYFDTVSFPDKETQTAFETRLFKKTRNSQSRDEGACGTGWPGRGAARARSVCAA
jgi:hypothetical protein